MKSLSRTGVAFAFAFLLLSLWEVISFFRGASGALDFLGYVTFPFSIFVNKVVIFFKSLFGFSYQTANWLEVWLDTAIGACESYFFGWLLERPFRR